MTIFYLYTLARLSVQTQANDDNRSYPKFVWERHRLWSKD